MKVNLLLFVSLVIEYIHSQTCPSTCDQCDINGCISCPTTKQLQASKHLCVCAIGYYEVHLSECLSCSNPYCYQCSNSNSRQCLSCGDQNITHRQLINLNCVCEDQFVNVAWSYNCQNTQFDIRMLRFQSNMIQQERIINLKSYVANSGGLSDLIDKFYKNVLITTTNHSQCHFPDQLDQALQQSCPLGQIYQRYITFDLKLRLDQNIFGAAYLNQNFDPSTNWFTDFNYYGMKIAQKFIYQRNLTLPYNIIGFQILNETQDSPLVLQCLIVEVLNVSFTSKNQRILGTKNQSQPYMQYVFYMGYDRSTLFEPNEVEDVVDLLMALINGCMDFCDSCSIFRNSITCNQCQGLRQFLNGSCQCVQSLALVDQCNAKCVLGCQQCIQDCYSCQDISKNYYINCTITIPLQAQTIQTMPNITQNTTVQNQLNLTKPDSNNQNQTQNSQSNTINKTNASNINSTTINPVQNLTTAPNSTISNSNSSRNSTTNQDPNVIINNTITKTNTTSLPELTPLQNNTPLVVNQNITQNQNQTSSSITNITFKPSTTSDPDQFHNMNPTSKSSASSNNTSISNTTQTQNQTLTPTSPATTLNKNKTINETSFPQTTQNSNNISTSNSTLIPKDNSPTDTSTNQIPQNFSTTSTPNATSSMINLTDVPIGTALINSTIIPKSLAKSDSSISQNPPTSLNLSLNKNTTQNPNVSDSSNISLDQVNNPSINSNQNSTVLNQIIPDFLHQNNSTNQTKSSQPDQKPLYGALGAIGAAVLIAAPLAYLYFAQRQATRFLPNQGIDDEGMVWPHNKFSLPSGREISQWERPLQNDTIERFLNQNQNYQQLLSQLHQQQTNASINF